MSASKRPRRDSDTRAGEFLEPASASASEHNAQRHSSSTALRESIGPSPQSDSSASSRDLTSITSRWFGLLAADVSNANHTFATPLVASRYPRSVGSAHAGDSPVTLASPAGKNTRQVILRAGSPGPAAARTTAGQPRVGSAGQLSEGEFILMNHFVHNLSTWLDLTDPKRHFSLFVPHLALHDEGLRKAVLALSARDMTTNPRRPQAPFSTDFQPDRSMGAEYYHETLQYLQRAMKDEAYLRSDELQCTIMLLSTYELMDGDGVAWERHLRGAYGVQRSLEINGESGGLKQAIWWSWLRQDLWAAYREHRKVYSSFVPTKDYSELDEWGMAERSVYLCCQCVNYVSSEEVEAGVKNEAARVQRGEKLAGQLDSWLDHLPPHYQQYPSTPGLRIGPFRPIWIHPPVFGNALQMHNYARLMLLSTKPQSVADLDGPSHSVLVEAAVDAICGIAVTIVDDAASVISSGSVFVAGMYTSCPDKRATILEILGRYKAQTGFPANDFRDELRASWASADAT
ncbi:hypothetical protein AAFC00_003341 [Neodothiora populina]|uniref:Uncharacterized protein n=1 Tax=Neodothiora populina TaxID=2781224 RepID=A0ABR3PA56_9PEZI